MSNLGILGDIAPIFRPYLMTVYEELKLGLCKGSVDIEKVAATSNDPDSQFRLVLPYCSKRLKWEVVFDVSCPWYAPDFRFDDDSFLVDVDEDEIEARVPSLANWDEKDPRMLNNVLTELVGLYKTHQVKKLNEDESSRASFEYSALLGDNLTSENDVEVWVGGHAVEFLIKLNVDISRLPELYNNGSEENPGVDSALLLVKYSNTSNAELILSPLLTTAIGNITLPPMHQSGVLMDYVPMVTKVINRRIQAVLNNDKMKRELLSQLIVKYEGAVLEHSANSAAFLFETNDFYWILHIDIDSGFPDMLPTLILRSVYHSNKGKPKTKVLKGCPYNNFEYFVEKEVETFKRECIGVTAKQQDIQENDSNDLFG